MKTRSMGFEIFYFLVAEIQVVQKGVRVEETATLQSAMILDHLFHHKYSQIYPCQLLTPPYEYFIEAN